MDIKARLFKHRLAIAACAVIADCLIIYLGSLSSNDLPTCDSGEAEANSFVNQFQVSVIHNKGTDGLTQQWQIAPTNGHAEPIRSVYLCFAIEALHSEIQKYPSAAIRALLKKIYLLDSLSFFDTSYGGTASSDSIFLVVNKKNTPNLETLSRLFHHELSSIILYSRSFELDKWIAANPADFTYLESERERLQAITNGIGDGDETLYAQGFLAEYAKTSFEDDFNLYAEYLFVYPERLRELGERYPAISKKTQLLKHHYTSVSDQFVF